MSTFSQLADEVVAEVRRPDRLASVASYINQTIRELHAKSSGTPLLYSENLIETQVTAGVDTGFSWEPAATEAFQLMRTVRFDSIINSQNGRPTYPPFNQPGRVLQDSDYYYYRAGRIFYFYGYGGIGATLSLAYYRYLERKFYYIAAERPAILVNGVWSYPAGAATPTAQAAAQALVTNWMITDWYETVKEGTLAKLFKAVGDDVRAKLSYSLYSNMREQLGMSADRDSLQV